MKSILFFLLLLLVSLVARAQTTQIQKTKVGIHEIETFVTSKDTSNNLVPHRQFAEFVRQGQRFVSGNAVQEGKITGTSAVVTDKAIAVNLGTNVIANRFSGQLNVQGTSQDGVVNLIKAGAYQNTLSIGASGNLFLRGFGHGTFYWSEPAERRRLRQTLLYQLNRDNALHPDCLPCTECAQQLAHYDLLAARLCSLRTAQPALVVARRQRVLDPCQDTAFYAQLRTALNLMKPLQPLNWMAMTADQEGLWLDSICCKPMRDAIAMRAKQRAENAAAIKSLAAYDSTILQAQWSTRLIIWFNGGILHNSTKLTRFASNQPPSFQTGDWNNQTTTFTGSLNAVVLQQHSRFYFSVGAQFIDRLNQLDDSLHTRYRTRSIVALTPPATVVDSVQAYRAGVHLPKQWTLNAEFSYYSLTAKVGVDATYKHYNPGLTGYGWLTTLGVFFPVVTSDASTILLMPQVSYNSHDKFTFGASLAASVPGFFTKAEKP